MSFNFDYASLRNQAKERAGTNKVAGAKLSGADWAGMGMQLAGGLLQDRQAEAALEVQQEREDRLLGDQYKQSALQRMIDARKWEDEQQQQTRQQNMTGLNFLANFRAQSQADSRKRSFRDALLKGGL